MSRRVRHPGVWLAGGVAAAVLLAALVLGSVTRSDRGRAWILQYTLQALGGRLNGQLVVDRLEGNVFTGARLYDLSLRGPDGLPLFVADSAFIEYDLPTFVGGDVVINELVVFSPDITLRRLPTDSLWNYQEILRDPTPGGGPGRATLVEALRLVDADARVLMAWEPDDDIVGREREREIEVALSDTSRLVVERVPGGLLRTIVLEVEEAVLSRLTISPDERGGTYLAVSDARGEVWLYQDEPLLITGLRGQMALREGVLRYEAPAITLPGSVAASAGIIDVTGDEPRYDLVISGDGVELADVQWLYPPIPDEGEISGRLWLETRPEGLLFLGRDLELLAPDTRVTGDLGMVVGDTVRFVEAELTADPLNVDTIREMIPAGLRVEGLRIGEVTIDTPAS